jgi:hypothetical protein
MHKRRRTFAFAAITFLAALVLIEAILQIAAQVSPRLDFILSTRRVGYRDDDQLVWRPHPGHPDHDRNGFRNAGVPKRADILAIGDSQTYGTGVKREETWIHQLGVLMGVQTYNMAYGGYGPLHGRVLLEEALDLKPRVVVEAMYTGNDLYECYALVYVDRRLPDSRTTDETTLSAIAMAESAHPGAPELPGLRAVDPPERGLRKTLSRHVKLYAFASACRRAIRNVTNTDNQADLLSAQDWSIVRDRAAARPDDFYVVEIDSFRTILTPRYRLAVLNPQDPRVEEGLRLSLEAIRYMHDRVLESGARFLVLLIPTKELVFKDLLAAHGAVPESLRELAEAEEAVTERIKQFLDGEGIEHVDALPSLRSCIHEGKQPYKITHDGHPNVTGHLAIAKGVQRALAVEP